MLATKANAIVAGQTSIKALRKRPLRCISQKTSNILSYHSLYAPNVSPAGQPLVLRTPLYLAQELIDLLGSPFDIGPAKMPDALTLVENILRSFRSRFVYHFDEHNSVTANIQAVTHAVFIR